MVNLNIYTHIHTHIDIYANTHSVPQRRFHTESNQHIIIKLNKIYVCIDEYLRPEKGWIKLFNQLLSDDEVILSMNKLLSYSSSQTIKEQYPSKTLSSGFSKWCTFYAMSVKKSLKYCLKQGYPMLKKEISTGKWICIFCLPLIGWIEKINFSRPLGRSANKDAKVLTLYSHGDRYMDSNFKSLLLSWSL